MKEVGDLNLSASFFYMNRSEEMREWLSLRKSFCLFFHYPNGWKDWR